MVPLITFENLIFQGDNGISKICFTRGYQVFGNFEGGNLVPNVDNTIETWNADTITGSGSVETSFPSFHDANWNLKRGMTFVKDDCCMTTIHVSVYIRFQFNSRCLSHSLHQHIHMHCNIQREPKKRTKFFNHSSLVENQATSMNKKRTNKSLFNLFSNSM